MITNEWRASIVKVLLARLPNDPESFLGSAFLVTRKLLLTCAHVVDGIQAEDIFVSGPAWTQTQRVAAIHRFAKRDIAILALTSDFDLVAPPIFVSPEIAPGPVTIAGYSSSTTGLEATPLEPRAYDAKVDAPIMHTHIARGLSGGPALQGKRFVGVTYARNVDEGKTYIIPVTAFSNFLSETARNFGAIWPIQVESQQFHSAPPLPTNFVRRSDIFGEVNAGFASGHEVVALVGLGGNGKTTMAMALARDPEIKMKFGDGVLWANVGSQAALLPILHEWLSHYIQDVTPYNNVSLATQQLRQILHDKKVLVIVDDVWSKDVVEQLAVFGFQGAMLMTTRDRRCLPNKRAILVEVNELDETSALDLVKLKIGTAATNIAPSILLNICCLLAFMPLALNLAASLIAEGIDAVLLERELSKELGRLQKIEFEQPTKHAKDWSVDASINISLERLSKDEILRLLLLATLKPQEFYDSQAASILWDCSEFSAQKTLALLSSKSLLSKVTEPGGEQAFRIHDLVRDKCMMIALGHDTFRHVDGDLPRFQTLDELHAYPARSLKKRRTQLASWDELDIRGYFRRQLFFHLSASKDLASMYEALVEDLPGSKKQENAWLAAQERGRGFAQYLVDLNTITKAARNEVELKLNNSSLTEHKDHEALSIVLSVYCISNSVKSRFAGVSLQLARALINNGVWQPLQAASAVERSLSPDQLIAFSYEFEEGMRQRLQRMAVRRLAFLCARPEYADEKERLQQQLQWASFLVEKSCAEVAIRESLENNVEMSAAQQLAHRISGFCSVYRVQSIETPDSGSDTIIAEATKLLMGHLTARRRLEDQKKHRDAADVVEALHRVARVYFWRTGDCTKFVNAITELGTKGIDDTCRAWLRSIIQSRRLFLFSSILDGHLQDLIEDCDARAQRYRKIDDWLQESGMPSLIDRKIDASYSGTTHDAQLGLETAGKFDDAWFISGTSYDAFLSELVEFAVSCRLDSARDTAEKCLRAAYHPAISAICATLTDDDRISLIDVSRDRTCQFKLACSIENEGMRLRAFGAAFGELERTYVGSLEDIALLKMFFRFAPPSVQLQMTSLIAKASYSRRLAEFCFEAFGVLAPAQRMRLYREAQDIEDDYGQLMLGARMAEESGTLDTPEVTERLLKSARSVQNRQDCERLVFQLMSFLSERSHLTKALLGVVLETAQGIGDDESVCLAIAQAASLLPEPARTEILKLPPICSGKSAIVIRPNERRNFDLRHLRTKLATWELSTSMVQYAPNALTAGVWNELFRMSDNDLARKALDQLERDIELLPRDGFFAYVAELIRELCHRGLHKPATETVVTMHDCYRWWP